MNWPTMLLKLDWWVYFIIVATLFAIGFFLNYVVKKINDSRIEERYNQLHSRISNSQHVLERRRLPTTRQHLPSRTPLEVVIEQSNPPTLKGISLIGERSDNIDHRTVKDRIDIKNFPNTAADLTVIANDETSKPSEPEIGQQIFLGKIYNEINIVGRSKSVSDADREDCSQESTSVNRKQESKSTPSVKKMMDNQYKPIEDFKNWPVKLVVEDSKATTSDDAVNDEVK